MKWANSIDQNAHKRTIISFLSAFRGTREGSGSRVTRINISSAELRALLNYACNVGCAVRVIVLFTRNKGFSECERTVVNGLVLVREIFSLLRLVY